LGKVNRKLQKWFDRIIISFPNVEKLSEKKKAVFIGPLVRNGFTEIGKKPYKTPANKGSINILITGGSQGAKIFSDCVPAACALLPSNLKNRLFITQQCREEDKEKTVKAYKESNIPHDVRSFIDDMPKQIEKAHLMICRSGASTLSEMIQSRRPGILVPYPYATDDHQRYNAQVLVDHKASWMLLDEDLTASTLCKTMENLLLSDKLLEEAAKNLKNLSADNAAQRFVDIIKTI
jgi:UDP-N-acetylglucosamine--N-acetylmuramyl-(pentapeptide) pyrophosphoryl-undecaprenol N-acetylglucosamine transferase